MTPKFFTYAGALTLALAAGSSQAGVVFDNISNYQAGVTGAAVTATSSTPNTFMGDAYTLAAGTTSITGFDLFPVNLANTTYTALKLNVYVWGTVNTGAVSAAAPAFSNLLSNFSVTSTGSYASGFFYNFESANPGVTPGLMLATPIAVSGSSVGVTINVQGSTDGVTFASVANLNSMISYGTAPTVGSMTLGGATGGYYRNANNETNGNFTSGLRTLTGLTNQGIAMRIYGDVSPVPEPATYALMGLGIAALALRRRAARAA